MRLGPYVRPYMTFIKIEKNTIIILHKWGGIIWKLYVLVSYQDIILAMFDNDFQEIGCQPSVATHGTSRRTKTWKQGVTSTSNLYGEKHIRPFIRWPVLDVNPIRVCRLTSDKPVTLQFEKRLHPTPVNLQSFQLCHRQLPYIFRKIYCIILAA